MLKAQLLSVSRNGQAVLDNASVDIRPGCLHVILGPNGAGKTSLLKALSGLTTVDSGSILLQGKKIQSYSVSERSLLMSVLLQEQSLDFPFKVRDVVSMGAYPVDATLLQMDSVVQQAMAALEIEHLADRNYTALSGGEKQRTHVARLLVQTTAATCYVLLDEPLKAIDLKHQVALMQQFRAMADQGKAVLLVLHDLTLAARFADTITLMDKGRIIKTGSVEQVMQPGILSSVFQTPINATQAMGHTLFFVHST